MQQTKEKSTYFDHSKKTTISNNSALISTKIHLDELIMMHKHFPCIINLQVYHIFFHRPRLHYLFLILAVFPILRTT